MDIKDLKVVIGLDKERVLENITEILNENIDAIVDGAVVVIQK